MGQAFGTAGAPGPDVLVLEASLGNVDNVKRILAYGELVDLNWATAKEKWTALHTAAKGGHLKVLQLLVDAGAFLHAVDAEGYCPVHLACAGGHEECVKYLVEKGAGFSFRNDGSWAIHDAAGHGHMGVVTYLVALSEGRCASLATATGKTPLHYATANGQVAVAQYLAEQPGVDKDAQTATGETPLFAAMGCPDKVRGWTWYLCVCVFLFVDAGPFSTHGAGPHGGGGGVPVGDQGQPEHRQQQRLDRVAPRVHDGQRRGRAVAPGRQRPPPAQGRPCLCRSTSAFLYPYPLTHRCFFFLL